MATTKIEPAKTAGEISQLLAKAGADSVITEYDAGEAIGISFSIRVNKQPITFSLPVRWQPILVMMQQDRSTARHLCNDDQARRVAWRIIFRWIQAQLALIETGSVEMSEIFLPYACSDNGQTVYESFKQNCLKQLTSGEVE